MNNILGQRLKRAREEMDRMTQADVVKELKQRHNIVIRQSHISNLGYVWIPVG